MNNKYGDLLCKILTECLIIDCETYAEYANGQEINIQADFDNYLIYAKIKWVGMYSYKYDKEYLFNATIDAIKIKEIINDHEILIGFNIEEFDYPILQYNSLIEDNEFHQIVDCMQILGNNTFRNRAGYKYKGRGALMDYSFKNNSLRTMAEAMKLETLKGEIDYHIFKKNKWTKQEEQEIKNYLIADVRATRQMLEKLWEFWKPFTDMLSTKYVMDLSWLKSSIAALTYKCACVLMGVEPTYSDKHSKPEAMGGRVIMPKYEEARNVWYLDYTSLYPHIFCMFNLFYENTKNVEGMGWHGNDLFKVRGYYFVNEPHVLNRQVQALLRERINLKKNDPDNPMVYAIKIFLNGLYGVVRSSMFEKVHTPNAGWDCCWLGQQIQEFTEKAMDEFGFEVIAGDTDSLFLVAKDEKNNNRSYVEECLAKILKKINDNVPFPVDTFDIKIENYLDYMMFPFSMQEAIDDKARQKINDGDLTGYKEVMVDKKKCLIEEVTGKVVKRGRSRVRELQGKKKNYLYIHDNKIELVGLPIKKDGATALGIKIFHDVLEPLILQNKRAKFSRAFIEQIINDYLKKPGIMELISQEYKIKPYDTYKNPNQIQAQISKAYLYNGDGIIRLIKNSKVGKCGKGMLYCTIDEALTNNLTMHDLDLEKLENELAPFIEGQKEIVKSEAIQELEKMDEIIQIDKPAPMKIENNNPKSDEKEIKCYYEE